MRTVVAGMGEVVTVARPQMPEMPADPAVDNRTKAVHTLSPEQKELREIRMRLRMTKATFSDTLGIKQCTLDSYEYGKTKTVPSGLMASARKLLKDSEGSATSNTAEGLANKSMADILNGWAAKLDIPVANATMLGKVLDATPMTIRRWRKNKVRPNAQRLAALASLVEGGAENAAQIIAIQAVRRLTATSGVSNGFCFVPMTLASDVLEKLNAISSSRPGLEIAIKDFEAELERCKKIPGKNGFYQMTASAMKRNTTRLKREMDARTDQTSASSPE